MPCGQVDISRSRLISGLFCVAEVANILVPTANVSGIHSFMNARSAVPEEN